MTGRERIVKLEAEIKAKHPAWEIRVTDFSNKTVQGDFLELVISDCGVPVCGVAWGIGTYGYQADLLEFYGNKTKGFIKEDEALLMCEGEMECVRD